MNPQEILDRLDKARAIIAALPPDARILWVEVDGTANIPGCSDTSYIHLANRLEDLVATGVIPPNSYIVDNEPDREYLEESILTGGFKVLSLRDRKSAAPSVDGTGGGEAEQSSTGGTNIITAGREEVNP